MRKLSRRSLNLVILVLIIGGTVSLMLFLPIFNFVNIDINGLQETYNVNEEIGFSATISGFGKSCAEIQAWVVGTSRPDFHQSIYYEIPTCSAGDVNMFFRYNIPRDENAFNFSLDEPGKYKATVIQKSLRDASTSSSEKSFVVTE
ncbi:MAG TPA: hypothetical protein VJP79_09005 [Nitrososphaera sp.]|nr:hypothetical protein [Nitrososphaera sp.]